MKTPCDMKTRYPSVRDCSSFRALLDSVIRSCAVCRSAGPARPRKPRPMRSRGVNDLTVADCLHYDMGKHSTYVVHLVDVFSRFNAVTMSIVELLSLNVSGLIFIAGRFVTTGGAASCRCFGFTRRRRHARRKCVLLESFRQVENYVCCWR